MPAVKASRSRADLAVPDRDGALEIATTSSRARTKAVSSGFITVYAGTQRPAGPARAVESPVRLFAGDVAGPVAAVILGALLHAAAAGLRRGAADQRNDGESRDEKGDFRLFRENSHSDGPLVRCLG